MKDRDQCVFILGSFLMTECCDSKTTCTSVFCRNLLCVCVFVTWCILYFLCYNWYFLFCMVSKRRINLGLCVLWCTQSYWGPITLWVFIKKRENIKVYSNMKSSHFSVNKSTGNCLWWLLKLSLICMWG